MYVEKRAGAIVLLEADRAPGAAAMSRAMDEAIAQSRSVHVGWCAARNITHAGAVGYFALRAADAGMAGIVMTASAPMMAYYGARVSGVSTNPIAIAVPGARHAPLLLDMSTATVAMGKIMAARDAGSSIPHGWGIDEEGRDTTDPHRVATLLPVGGAKGSGLSLMIECLASLTLANPILSLALSPSGIPGGTRLNGIAIALDLSAFGDLEGFRADVDQLCKAISALPPASGFESTLLPGERGDRVKSKRETEGIPLPKGTWTRLVAIAEELGVPLPKI
jgi:ureidoglycolate dehydrogenase (NAD+)